ncbi:hypothetical protein Y032_0038g3622 [Ancylostoma ceylanicum]|uniref:Uncharacterized protein n=1 Tax=Ancylostoma ceylanicum TaxID=53326 RepID=A0A016UJL5_9BILA|nr:hypothetical protein Y032_0038g3622 [Ancylostoma ceylanicum]
MPRLSYSRLEEMRTSEIDAACDWERTRRSLVEIERASSPAGAPLPEATSDAHFSDRVASSSPEGRK